MKLLGDAINELAEPSVALISPLLKTKILAYRINNKPLLDWVNKEIKGYDFNDELPSYRIVAAHLTMNYLNHSGQYNDQPVPLDTLPEKVISLLTDMRFMQSIAVIEAMAQADSTLLLENPIPSYLIRIVQDNIRKIGNNPYLEILALTKSAPVTSANGVISAVRERLLEFMLELEVAFGQETDIITLQERNPQVTTIMRNTINNYGNGNITNTGDKAIIKAKISIQQQNFNTLAEALRANGVDDDDITELAEVINTDVIDRETKRFGPLVNKWTNKMFGKALDGTWVIALDIAGGLLTELIKAYYGIGN